MTEGTASLLQEAKSKTHCGFNAVCLSGGTRTVQGIMVKELCSLLFVFLRGKEQGDISVLYTPPLGRPREFLESISFFKQLFGKHTGFQSCIEKRA